MKRSYLDVIEILIQTQPYYINKIKDQLNLDRTTVSRKIDKMEELGYLKSYRSNEDSRMRLIFLNPENEEVKKYLEDRPAFEMPDLYYYLEEKGQRFQPDKNEGDQQFQLDTKLLEEVEELRTLTTLLSQYFKNSSNYLQALIPFKEEKEVSKEEMFDILVESIQEFQNDYMKKLKSLKPELVQSYIITEAT